MAPKTTGIRSVDADRSYALNQHALWLAEQYLSKGGCLLVKAFQGAPFQQLQQEFRQMFTEVKICKPKSSRSESVEIFLLGKKKQESQVEEVGHLPEPGDA
jgi:23S rRNA (uridine2552-2'-O)-methyltransferase